MKNEYVLVRDNVIGYGIDAESREEDWLINKLGMEEELPWKYRKELMDFSPWFPNKQMLHISGVGCLKYSKQTLVNTANNQSVEVAKCGKSIYYYLMRTIGMQLAYKDIRVTLRPYIESFFTNISVEFNGLVDYDTIMVMNDTDLAYGTRYDFESYSIFMSGSMLGLKPLLAKQWYILTNSSNWEFDICYLAYRVGIDVKEVIL